MMRDSFFSPLPATSAHFGTLRSSFSQVLRIAVRIPLVEPSRLNCSLSWV